MPPPLLPTSTPTNPYEKAQRYDAQYGTALQAFAGKMLSERTRYEKQVRAAVQHERTARALRRDTPRTARVLEDTLNTPAAFRVAFSETSDNAWKRVGSAVRHLDRMHSERHRHRLPPAAPLFASTPPESTQSSRVLPAFHSNANERLDVAEIATPEPPIPTRNKRLREMNDEERENKRKQNLSGNEARASKVKRDSSLVQAFITYLLDDHQFDNVHLTADQLRASLLETAVQHGYGDCRKDQGTLVKEKLAQLNGESEQGDESHD